MSIKENSKREGKQKDLLTMKAFRKARSDDYGYLVLADRLLREYR